MTNQTIKVVLADDHPRVRAGIRNLLTPSPDIQVVGEARDGLEALDLVNDLRPDVLVLDVEMPKMNGQQVAQRLKDDGSPVHVLALSAYDDKEYILGMLENGAVGYLTKDEAPEVLAHAIRGVSRGEQGWVSQRVASIISSLKEDIPLNGVSMTPREKAVLDLVIEKRTDQEIATTLGISEGLVQRHVELLCLKLKTSSRVELAVIGKQFNGQVGKSLA
jgi:DNA-binding NarL/FixJ family response regulator